MSRQLRAIYCSRHELPPEQFETAVFHYGLYPHARLLRWLFDREYFTADLEFIRSVANLRSRRDFSAEATGFHQHPDNRSFLRRVLRLRVSASRIRRLLDEEFEIERTAPPF